MTRIMKAFTHSISVGHDPFHTCFHCSLADGGVRFRRRFSAQADDEEVMATQGFDNGVLLGVIYTNNLDTGWKSGVAALARYGGYLMSAVLE